MDARNVRRRRALVAGLASAAVVTTLGFGSPVWAADSTDGSAPHVSPNTAHSALKLSQTLQAKTFGRQAVFVELSGSGAADVAAAASSKAAGKAAANTRRAQIKTTAASAFAAAKSKDAKATQLFTVTNAVPGFAAQLNQAAIDELATRSDVVKISSIVPKSLENASTAQLTNAVADWKANNLGKDVSVGIIDTGIDYTHADFGGVGTIAAWNAAHATSTDPNWRDSMTALAQAKVVGGYDFAGDDYNADPAAADYQPVAHPDANPLGCNDHGTHVAGIVGGYGENANGSTFTGDYASLSSDDLYNMEIGPGMAPLAQLYALKVFGCTGSTDVVIPALDWALDPNGDGDFSDHLDIVNLSLGSDFAPADDPENSVVDKLAAHGVLPVIAMGNAGDLTDAGGSPGNAVRSVAVASTVDAYQLRDGLKVNAPANLAGIVDGQFSIAYPWATASTTTGDVVASPADNADGCKPYSAADAAAIAGKVVWQVWDDNDSTRACGSAARGGNAAKAGAIGAIFTSSLDVFGAGITGVSSIPIIQLPKAQTDRLQAAVTAGTLNVTFDPSLAASVKSITPAISDTLSSFSSRGTHGSVGVVKPDIAAPGDTIASAGLGTGDKPLVISGTSMATPNVAGIAALVKVAHPTWTTEQLKADLMNTAGHDVYSGDSQSGPIYGPNRVGAGRVDAATAVTNDVLVYSKDVTGAVSASFGVVPVPITSKKFTQTRTLVVQNTGATTRTVSLSYDAITAQPGVTYTVSPSTVTLAAGKSTTATVTLSVDPTKLRKTIDPTMDTDSGVGVPRQYISDSSGRVLVAEQGKTALRVPVYGAVKPTSATTTKAVSFGGTTSLNISGSGFALGQIGADSTAFTSLASVLQLGDTSGKLKSCVGAQTSGCLVAGSDASGDLRYVGAGSAEGLLYFGINTYGQWAAAGNSMIPFVDIDTNADGKPDYEVYMQSYPSEDVPLAYTVDLATGDVVDLEPVNLNWGDVDTNVFDSDTVLLPVDPTLIGMAKGATTFPITYQVGTYSVYAGDLDASNPVAYDVAAPALQVGSSLYLDRSGVSIPYTLGASATKDTQALILHLQGAPGDRAEVVSVTSTKTVPVKPSQAATPPWQANHKHSTVAPASR